jgi:hypothetical protein
VQKHLTAETIVRRSRNQTNRNFSRKACPETSKERKGRKEQEKSFFRTWRSSRLGGRNIRT